jgi:NADPH:quinone reductase-like Zn-dependent oxidoreductase
MKAWQLHDFGLENLRLDEVPTPTPGPHDLLIRVGAVSLNFRDKAIVDGIYEPQMIPKPLIPVSDAAGEVIQVGAAVTRFKVGDRVTSHLYSHWLAGEAAPDEPDYCFGAPLPGGLAEYMIIQEESAVAAPANMTDEEAATLPIAALTAWFSLVHYGKLQAGQSVLIQGTGGVALFGVQIAKALGARVIVLTSSTAKAERVKALGADEVVNYVQQPDWENAVLALTNGRGVDQVLEVVGGDGLNQSIKATRPEGQVAVVGFLQGQTAQLDLMNIIFRKVRVQGIAVGHRQAFEEMNQALVQHNIQPVIDTVYSFDQAKAAYEHQGRGGFGKIVIRVGSASEKR